MTKIPSKEDIIEALNHAGSIMRARSIANFAKFLGAIRSSMTPKQKDYWHISLSTAPAGLRTTPIPTPDGNTFEILLNLVSDYLSITTSKGYSWSMMLSGQTLDIFSRDVIAELNKFRYKSGYRP